MRIIYFANHGNKGSDDTEGHIAFSLSKLGHEVLRVHERNDPTIEKGDLFLFHKGGKNIFEYLPKIKMPKIFWYFDKVEFNDRVKWITRIMGLIDLGFTSDETWVKKSGQKRLFVLRQGIGDRIMSNYTPKIVKNAPKIAFTGSIYGKRIEWVKRLENRYGSRFRAVNSYFNENLYDLCASTQIIVAPEYPGDDYYWSSRIYMILGSGGFLVHPKFKGLEKEYIDGYHYVGYQGEEELFQKIDYYLERREECDKIRKQGQEKTHKDYSYTKRCEKLLEILQQNFTGKKG